jgi:hypothetical protein
MLNEKKCKCESDVRVSFYGLLVVVASGRSGGCTPRNEAGAILIQKRLPDWRLD